MLRRRFLLGIAAILASAWFPVNAFAGSFVSDRITVRTVGHGPDIVLIPGLASPADVFAGTADAFKGRYRLHLVQVNGFAGSAPGRNADGPIMAPVAEEIVRYIHERHLNRPAIVGHSMGGGIGLMIAARHPDLIDRLMIVDMIPFAGAYFVSPDATSETAQPRADELATKILATPPGTVAPVLVDIFSGMTRTDSARVHILEWLRASDARVVAQSFHDVITTDLRPELAHITVPVTVLYVLPAGSTEHPLMVKGYANLPQARLVLVENSNHFIMLDQPQRMNAELEAFMHAEARRE